MRKFVRAKFHGFFQYKCSDVIVKKLTHSLCLSPNFSTYSIGSKVMEKDTKYCLDYFSKLEERAQDILIDKEHILEYSRRSNALREAKRALQAELRKSNDSKTWLCFGNMFIKCPKSKALSIVEKDESLINDEINKLRDELKPKVENIRNMEGETDFKFNLKPLNKEEVAAMRSILPRVV